MEQSISWVSENDILRGILKFSLIGIIYKYKYSHVLRITCRMKKVVTINR